MNRRSLLFVGGVLPTIVCVSLALAQGEQEQPYVPFDDVDAGATDGGQPDADEPSSSQNTPPEPVSAEVPPSTAEPLTGAGQQLEAGADRETGLKGRVYDAKTRTPMPIAPVLVTGGGKTRSTITDDKGGYRLYVPPGTYSVMSYYDLYHGARVKGARVVRGKLLNLNLMLLPLDENEDVSIEEVEVAYRADTTSAAAQDQLRLASANIGEGFGAKQMSQVGASDAGGAAARVVGVQVEDNQLVVRGLGGRYTRVLLNGIPVPSTDPDLPGADLDLFPTNVIDSLSISKTFLPNSPADFAGGLMEIKSVNFPRKFTFEVGLSTGVNSQSTFRKNLTYQGGKYDFLSYDDGGRSLPAMIPPDEPVTITRSGRYPSFDAIYEATRSFSNRWQYKYTDGLPKLGVSATLGASKKFGDRSRFGYLLTASYDYEMVRRVGIARPRPVSASDGTLTVLNDYKLETGTEEVALNAFGTASVDLGPDHSMTVLSLFNRAMSDETQLQRGINGELGNDTLFEKWQLQFLARSLLFNQLFGDHRNLGNTRLRLRWAAFQSSGRREEPDRRTIAYGPEGGAYRWLTRSGSGERFYSDLQQNDLGATSSLRFPLWPESWGTIGAWTQRTSRDFDNRRFRMLRATENGVPAEAFSAPIEEIFGPAGIGRLARIGEFTRDDDSYRAKQVLYAGYMMLETPLIGRLSLAGGARAEIFKQEVESFNIFRAQAAAMPGEEMRTDRTDTDYLPGANLKYQIDDSMVLRAAYGVTVSRPQARELAPFQYYDFVRDRNIVGNPDLSRTLIQNVDLRWEWFIGEGEVVAFSTFYKKFDKPIELVISNPNYDSQFRNAKGATNVGAEGEARINLKRLAPSLKLFSIDGNFALVQSKIQINPEDAGSVTADRPLYGQAPYVANLALRFHEPDTQLSASLVYNVVGPRLSDVGVRSGDLILPNINEQAFHSLDLVSSVGVGKHLKIKARARNLLLQTIRLKQGDFLTQRVEPGLTVSLSLSYEH